MSDFFGIFRPDFLLHNALLGCIAVGLFCPLIGVYFMLRRTVLLGVTLPQISAAGISFMFFLQGAGVAWLAGHGEAQEQLVALLGSLLFTFAALALFAFLERRGEGTPESRLGAAYAIAYAASILWVTTNPSGRIEVLHMLHGEIVAVSTHDLRQLLVVYSVLAAVLLGLNRLFLLVSFDKESARVMGKNVLVWDAILYTVIGTAISMGVLIVGPVLTFALMMIPPLAARRFCRRMRGFFLLSSVIGGLSGLIGFYASYRLDWPLSPTVILASFLILGGAVLVRAVTQRHGGSRRRLVPTA
jgi:ABC-type Mn2+/Zn2+ transport system permease subunit